MFDRPHCGSLMFEFSQCMPLKFMYRCADRQLVNLDLLKNLLASLSKTNLTILVVIAVVAVLLSVFSYQYYTFTSAKISDIALREIETNAQIQVHDLSQNIVK